MGAFFIPKTGGRLIAPHHITQACRRTQDALLVATEKPSPKFDPGGGSASTAQEGAPTPAPIGIISAKRELADWLVDWCSLVRDGLEVVATYDLDEHSRLQWLGTGERAEYLANHDAGMDFLDEITVLTRQLESPYVPRRIKKYIGNYGGGAVYVREGQDAVELADGTTVPVAEIRDTNSDMILNRTGTALQVSRIIKAYFKFDLDPKKIKDAERYDRKKTEGVKLEHVRIDDGAYVYRVEDVLNRLFAKEISPKT